MMERTRGAWLLVIGTLLGSLPALGAGPRYDNTFRKDFIMDAPWRIEDAQAAIPLTIILKDCDTDDIRQLHWIRCWDVTSGETLLWGHDFGDERIGDDPAEANYWTYITTVTEGHPQLLDGTPLAPANLGYGPGDAINLKVSIYYRDDIFNYTETRYLRVHVAQAPLPWPADWYGGDLHYHTMYTNNIAEFGAPLPSVTLTAQAIGLDWLITTDHSCDLDEMGDGSFSYRTDHWECTLQGETGTQTIYRDNTAIGSTWDVLGEEVALFDSADLRLYRGVELNMASIDPTSFDRTLHCLVVNESYIHSPLSGAIGERPVYPSVPDALDQIAGAGFALAAHPRYDLGLEWGGLDWGVNGAPWGAADIGAALARENFLGLQIFNMRETRYSSDQMNPWPSFDAGTPPAHPYPGELLEGIDLWDEILRANLTPPLRKVFIAGGSDAHGDFNFASFFALDNYATDNALGKVQTVIFAPAATELLAQLCAGHAIVTDGPFLEMGIDRNGDGDFLDADELMIGDDGAVHSGETLPCVVRWASQPDFGGLAEITLIAANATETITLLSIDPTATGEEWSGARTLDLGPAELEGLHYFRAYGRTADGGSGHRAFTNPIWIDFLPFSDASVSRAGGLALSVLPGDRHTDILCTVPSGMTARLTIHDLSGRLIRRYASIEGRGRVAWGHDDMTARSVSPGIFFLTLEGGGLRTARRSIVIR